MSREMSVVLALCTVLLSIIVANLAMSGCQAVLLLIASAITGSIVTVLLVVLLSQIFYYFAKFLGFIKGKIKHD